MKKKAANRINLIKSLPAVSTVHDVKYEPNFFFSYALENDAKKQLYLFQTHLSEKEKGDIIKERNKKMFLKSAIFGFSAFFSVAILSFMRGDGFTMQNFLTFLIQIVVMEAVVSLVLIIASMVIPKAFPNQVIIAENRLQVVNSKGKKDVEILLSDIGFVNIVQGQKVKFICFSTINADEGAVLRNSPIFDITNKSDEIYLKSLLKSLTNNLAMGYQERRFSSK